MPDARAHAPATSCLPLAPGRREVRHATPSDPSHSSSRPRPSAPSLSPEPERSHRRRLEPPRPQVLPRLSDAPPSSAVTSPSLPRSHKTPDALEHRHRRHLLPLHRRPSSLDSPATERPRPRPRARWTRGEPLNRSPLLPMPLGRSSHCFRRTRELAAAVPRHQRGWSRCSSKQSTPPHSTRLQEPVAATSFPSRAPERQPRPRPSSGRRLARRRC